MNDVERSIVLGTDQNNNPVNLKFPNADPSAGSTEKKHWSEALISALIRRYMGLAVPVSKHQGGWKQWTYDRDEARSKARLARRARRVNRLKAV